MRGNRCLSLGFLWRLCFTPRIPCGLAPFLLSLLPRPKQVIRWLRIALPPRHFLTACCLLPVVAVHVLNHHQQQQQQTAAAAALFTLCLSFPHALTSPSPLCLNFYFARGVTFGIRPLISFALSDVPSTAERSVGGTLLFFLSISCSAPHFYSFCPFLLCIIPPPNQFGIDLFLICFSLLCSSIAAVLVKSTFFIFYFHFFTSSSSPLLAPERL
ncbi:hypothetical protein I7I50_05910 [Histoplasma capsulatum G186AR]|uniref:Uncharacterized protein n=1 Tax=Ajellomyces capsulatus TaxID=5037 RepID=A0A8H7ZDD8_AJECA|nr:hypothetical protein I7I52_04169 [Histoplasma capsulatum]QSS76451.1 hypothetical protein I7I50_05910 [Histoplasma capsulatum G186AR]